MNLDLMKKFKPTLDWAIENPKKDLWVRATHCYWVCKSDYEWSSLPQHMLAIVPCDGYEEYRMALVDGKRIQVRAGSNEWAAPCQDPPIFNEKPSEYRIDPDSWAWQDELKVAPIACHCAGQIRMIKSYFPEDNRQYTDISGNSWTDAIPIEPGDLHDFQIGNH